ncbi:MAG: AAA family ATPase [Candidatus Altiarchaeota archaeon]
MVKIIAVSGKGGVGKTLLSALLVRAIKESGKGSLLAIDADPDSNLAESLNVKFEKTVGDIREDLLSEKLPPGVEKEKHLSSKVFEITVEEDGFDLIVMGRPEGPGCYCAINHLLRNIIDETTQAYDYCIIDAEAGLEHMSRRTTQNVNTMLIVTDPSKKGFLTARRIKDLAKELGIEFDSMFLVLNRVKSGNRELMLKEAKEVGIDVIGLIPEDTLVAEYDLEGKPLINLPADSEAYNSVSSFAGGLT